MVIDAISKKSEEKLSGNAREDQRMMDYKRRTHLQIVTAFIVNNNNNDNNINIASL